MEDRFNVEAYARLQEAFRKEIFDPAEYGFLPVLGRQQDRDFGFEWRGLVSLDRGEIYFVSYGTPGIWDIEWLRPDGQETVSYHGPIPDKRFEAELFRVFGITGKREFLLFPSPYSPISAEGGVR